MALPIRRQFCLSLASGQFMEVLAALGPPCITPGCQWECVQAGPRGRRTVCTNNTGEAKTGTLSESKVEKLDPRWDPSELGQSSLSSTVGKKKRIKLEKLYGMPGGGMDYDLCQKDRM